MLCTQYLVGPPFVWITASACMTPCGKKERKICDLNKEECTFKHKHNYFNVNYFIVVIQAYLFLNCISCCSKLPLHYWK